MEKKVHFKLHKVKKHWVTIAVTGLTLGLSFAGLNYASAEEQPTPVNEATVEAIIKEGAIDIEAPATSEATAKPTEHTCYRFKRNCYSIRSTSSCLRSCFNRNSL